MKAVYYMATCQYGEKRHLVFSDNPSVTLCARRPYHFLSNNKTGVLIEAKDWWLTNPQEFCQSCWGHFEGKRTSHERRYRGEEQQKRLI